MKRMNQWCSWWGSQEETWLMNSLEKLLYNDVDTYVQDNGKWIDIKRSTWSIKSGMAFIDTLTPNHFPQYAVYGANGTKRALSTHEGLYLRQPRDAIYE